MSVTDTVLQVRGLTKAFGANTVLRGIDLDVPRGKVVALIGPSGSGKTTILRSIIGLEVPDAGSVTVGASVDKARGTGQPLTVDFGAPQLSRRHALASWPRCATAAPWSSSTTSFFRT